MVPILFCVRASRRDGLGHLVRSLAVLREACKLVPVHLLVLGDGSGEHLIAEAAVPFTRCATDSEAAYIARSLKPHMIVFDMLRFDTFAFRRLEMSASIASLSPQFNQMNRVHYLFHRTAHEHPEWSNQIPFPHVYKGLEFTVLPPGLRPVSTAAYREQLEEERLGVAISMGGSDPSNDTLSLLQEFGKTNLRLVVWVALGDAYPHSYGQLLDCAARNRQEIILLKSNESMWRVLRNASLVLCAGGLTTYEAAFVGLPTINLIRKPEWQYLFEELVASGASYVLPPAPECTLDAVSLVAELEGDRQRLLECHLATKGLIPDGGARRIATTLTALVTRAAAA